MYKFIDFFITRSKLNHVLLIFLFIAGIYSYQNMSKEIFPPILQDIIIINGEYLGASANTLDKMAVSSIESKISNISGIKEISSTINSNSFVIEAKIEDKNNKNTILQQVKDAISKAKQNFPADMNEPTATLKVASFPLIIINIASKQSNHDFMIEVAKEFKNEITQIKDLANIEIYGEGDKQIQISLDSNKIKAYKLNLNDVINVISSFSSIFPIGKIEQNSKHFFISTQNGINDIEKLKQIMIKINGKVLYLGDIANIKKAYQNDSILASFNANTTLSINISKSKNGNAIKLAQQIKEKVKIFQEKYPTLSFGYFANTSVYIKNRLDTIIANIFFGLILVGASIYILVNKRISFIVVFGIPTSFVISLIFFYLSGYSINMMSLLGALIALGVIVDDAIIVAENIQRHIEEGMPIKQACIVGAKEVITPVFAASITTVFAFLPMLLMSGEMGEFIKIVPIAISFLILASVIESFIFLPIHAKDFLKKDDKKVSWEKFGNLYKNTIKFFIKYKISTLVFFYVLIPLLIFMGLKYSKFELFSKFDGDQINVSVKLPVDTSLKQSFNIAQKLENKILSLKDKYYIQSVTTMAGMRMNAKVQTELGSNLFHIFIDLQSAKADNFFETYITPILLLDFNQSEKTRISKSYDIEKQLRKELLIFIKNFNYEEFDLQGPRAGIVNKDIEIYIQSHDDEKSIKAVNEIKTLLKNTQKVNTISDNASYGVSELKLIITPFGQSLGINEKMLVKFLSGYFLKSKVATSFDKDGIVEIITKDKDKNLLSTLMDYEISLELNKKIKLKDVVKFKEIKSFERIYKKNNNKQRLVSANVNDNYNVTEVTNSLKPKLKEIQKEGVKIILGGEEEANAQLFKEMGIAFIVAIFLIFITLLTMFNSFWLTFMILSVIPFSMLGVVFGHLFMGINLSMSSVIGALGLAGVVINDGIIMIDFIKNTTNTHELLQKAKLRLRPIFLTSVTTFLGLSSLLFFPSGQAVIMQPLAISLGFGLLWGTFLNLIYLPTLFSFIKHKV